MYIIVSITFKGIHNWPGAPAHRGYLRSPHRHEFRVTAWARVRHDNRDLEFHDMIDMLNSVVKTKFPSMDLGSQSCEMLCRIFLAEIPSLDRVQVNEDDSCGAILDRKELIEISSKPKPRIITICGSSRHKEEWLAAMKILEDLGIAVFSIGSWMHADSLGFSDEFKKRLDALHKKKIDISDGIYVLNVGGYIGSSTRSEIEYAEKLNKEIWYLEAIGDNRDDIRDWGWSSWLDKK